MSLDQLELQLRRVAGVLAVGFVEADDLCSSSRSRPAPTPTKTSPATRTVLAAEHAGGPVAVEVVRWGDGGPHAARSPPAAGRAHHRSRRRPAHRAPGPRRRRGDRPGVDRRRAPRRGRGDGRTPSAPSSPSSPISRAGPARSRPPPTGASWWSRRSPTRSPARTAAASPRAPPRSRAPSAPPSPRSTAPSAATSSPRPRGCVSSTAYIRGQVTQPVVGRSGGVEELLEAVAGVGAEGDLLEHADADLVAARRRAPPAGGAGSRTPSGRGRRPSTTPPRTRARPSTCRAPTRGACSRCPSCGSR